MKILVGLGNPGAAYKYTRHNLGFRVIDCLAEAWDVVFKREASCKAWVGSCGCFEEKVLLVKPNTFMNASGLATRLLLDKHNLAPKDLVVLLDDIALPLGTVRIRRRGGGGGHNGLVSIVEELRSEEFSRIRLGICTQPLASKDFTQFVLGEFSKQEQKAVEVLVGQAMKAVEMIIKQGLSEAMNQFNKMAEAAS